MNHRLHSFPSTNNFVLEHCHIVSTVTTNGIVPGTSVSDSHTDTAAGTQERVGLHKLLSHKGTGNCWYAEVLLLEHRKTLPPCWEVLYLLKYWNRGYVSTLNHAEGYFWRKDRKKIVSCLLCPWGEVPTQSSYNFLTHPQPKTVLFFKDVIEGSFLFKLKELNTKDILLSQTW